MAVFDRQIYFSEMEWGDESNKKWFKIAQRTTYLIKFITITVFLNIPKQSKVKSVVLPECLGVNSSRSMFFISHLSKLPILWVYIPFLASLVVFLGKRTSQVFSNTKSFIMLAE